MKESKVVYIIGFFVVVFLAKITSSQVGILVPKFVEMNESYLTEKITILSTNDSIVELGYREANVFEVLNSYKDLIYNLSEQKGSIKIEFFENPISFAKSEKYYASLNSIFVLRKDVNAEPGYRLIYVRATKIIKTNATAPYSVNLVPVVESPMIVFVNGLAIRKIEIKDVGVVYEDVPKIAVILKNSGTVTTSFLIYLNISNKTFSSYDFLKPNEIKTIKFPLNFFGKYNATVFVNYFSGNFSLEKEIEIEKKAYPIIPILPEIKTNYLPYIIVIISIIVAIIILKKRREE